MPRSYLEEVKITEATSDQIGRILGDRLRMEGDALGDGYGELGRDFLLSAGRTLERAYRNDNGLPPDVDPSVERAPSPGPSPHSTLGPPIGMKPFVVTADHLHDPRLQAVYGLYEHDLGNNLLARDFLEAAVRSRVVRPKAYLALADILDAQAKLVSTREDEKLSEEQAGPILKLLNAAFQQAPTADLCSRIIETWEGSDAKPAEEDIARIAEDAALFPRDLDLVYGAAAFCAQAGYDAPAVKLIKMGLGFATYDFDKDDFEQLRSTLRSQPKTP